MAKMTLKTKNDTKTWLHAENAINSLILRPDYIRKEEINGFRANRTQSFSKQRDFFST
jgi:hypothetical protein